MRLVTFSDRDNTPMLGALIEQDSKVAVLQKGHLIKNDAPSSVLNSMLDYVQGGRRAFDIARETLDYIQEHQPEKSILPKSDVTLFSPMPVPESIRDCMVFEQHIINCTRSIGLGKLAGLDEAIEKLFGRRFSLAYRVNKSWYERPSFYKSNRFSVVGHEAEVIIPAYADKLDYELEWGIVLGQSGADIKASNAHTHIAGYTIFNDFSARDMQLREMKNRLGPAKGKDFDTGNAIGPCLVTPDEIPDPYHLEMKAFINGEEWSRGTTADMHWSFEEIIEYVSRSETLRPGEFIGSGTCSGDQGRGCGLEHGKFLEAGDEIELYVEMIGSLKNRLISHESKKT